MLDVRPWRWSTQAPFGTLRFQYLLPPWTGYPFPMRRTILNAFAGRIEETHRAMVRMRQLDPALRISNLSDRLPPMRPEDLERYAEGLRKAGLPE
jgi:hypothetical protein